MGTTAPQLVALVDIEDLADGDLPYRIAEIDRGPAAGLPWPRRPASTSPAPRGAAAVDAVVAARGIARDRRAALHAHRLGARAAQLVV